MPIQGVSLTGLRLGSSPSGERGLLASEALRPHARLLLTPRPLITTDADARTRQPLVRHLARSSLRDRPELQLVAYLVLDRAAVDLREEGKAIPHDPLPPGAEGGEEETTALPASAAAPLGEYYASCPQAYEEVPLFWSEECAARLLPASLLPSLRETRAELHHLREAIRCVAPQMLSAAEVAWRAKGRASDPVSWAFQTVRSRAFNLTMRGKNHVALVPGADMINHGSGAAVNVKWEYDEAVEAFVFSAKAGIKQGSELLSSYGHKSNSELLLQ